MKPLAKKIRMASETQINIFPMIIALHRLYEWPSNCREQCQQKEKLQKLHCIWEHPLFFSIRVVHLGHALVANIFFASERSSMNFGPREVFFTLQFTQVFWQASQVKIHELTAVWSVSGRNPKYGQDSNGQALTLGSTWSILFNSFSSIRVEGYTFRQLS